MYYVKAKMLFSNRQKERVDRLKKRIRFLAVMYIHYLEMDLLYINDYKILHQFVLRISIQIFSIIINVASSSS